MNMLPGSNDTIVIDAGALARRSRGSDLERVSQQLAVANRMHAEAVQHRDHTDALSPLEWLQADRSVRLWEGRVRFFAELKRLLATERGRLARGEESRRRRMLPIGVFTNRNTRIH